MSRRKRRPLVPNAGNALNQIKTEAMRKEGYTVNPEQPDQVKYEVARSMGIPLQADYNGQLTTENAGKIGGKIGGAMVKEMILQAQKHLAQQPNR